MKLGVKPGQRRVLQRIHPKIYEQRTRASEHGLAMMKKQIETNKTQRKKLSERNQKVRVKRAVTTKHK